MVKVIEAWVRVSLLAALVMTVVTGAQAESRVAVLTASGNDCLPAWIAKDKGFNTRDGFVFDVSLTQAGASDLAASLYANSAQIAEMTALTFATANENGLDLVIVAGAGIQTEANPRQVLVRPSADIKKVADFVGKKVGTPGLNGVLHIMFEEWLKNEGVNPSKVDYVETPFPRMADLLGSGQIDAALPVEPFATRIKESGIGVPAGDYITSVNKVTLLSFYVATRSWAEANPKAVAAFRGLLRDGEAFIDSHPDEARSIEAKDLHIPPEIVGHLPFTATDVDVPASRLQFWLDLSKEFGITKQSPEAARFIAQ